MNEPVCKTPHLVVWYREFLETGQSAAFVSSVSGRYSLATLQRMTTAPDHEVRRAAVLALGLLGGGESIPAVGRCLGDRDRCVRLVAEIAFGDLTRRQLGMGPWRQLDVARRHLDGQRYQQALVILVELSEVWPEFADAWYFRAICYFCLGKYRAAAGSARKAVRLNEFHYAALTLLARCCLERDRVDQALQYFWKSLQVNPSQGTVRSYVEFLSRRARR